MAPVRAEKPVPTRPTWKVWALGVILVASAALYWVYRNTGRPATAGALYQPVRITSYPGFEELAGSVAGRKPSGIRVGRTQRRQL